MFNLISNGRNAHKTMRYKVSAIGLAEVKNKQYHILRAGTGGIREILMC